MTDLSVRMPAVVDFPADVQERTYADLLYLLAMRSTQASCFNERR